MTKMASPDRTVKFAFATALVILLFVGAFSYRSLVISAESDEWALHSHDVLGNLQDLLYGMERIESSSRGYVLTGEESYLGSIQAGVVSSRQHDAAIRTLTADNPEQQGQIAALENLVEQNIQFADTVTHLRQTEGFDAALKAMQSAPLRHIMTAFRIVFFSMQSDEQGLLNERLAAAKRLTIRTEIFLVLGTVLGLLTTAAAAWSVYRDSSGRALAETALRNSEERSISGAEKSAAKYRGLLEAAPDAMVVVNQNGEIVLLNVQAEKQFGYHRDELLGQKVTNIIPAGFAERLIADGTRTATEALAQQIGTGIELTGRRKDGSEFPIELMLSPLESADGILVTAAIRDISVRNDAEQHLVQMEGRYRGLLEAAPDAMVVVNQGGDIVLLNLQAEKQFGYRRDELLGQKVTNIIPQGFAERLVADGLRTAEDALAQQIGTGIELTARRKDGSEFPIELMLSPLESTEGILVTAAIRDISVRKDAEQHLVQMEGRYRGLLEAAPDAMVVVNQGGDIVLVNLQAEKQFGYRRDELLGQKVTNIIPQGFAERLVADGLRSAEDALAQQIGTGIELTARRRDGSEFPIELMLIPLGGAEGILVTAAIRDISVRKNAERHLAQIEGKYRDCSRRRRTRWWW